ncbi:lipid A export permease/ATP-binding protein MsbA [Ideonella dechloratans]|uniref:Lipid A export permease/ATP-binding protein MsbA n=1 Tax=Ideonella dechloratans TaxID=36863 RepID=A0A643FCZ3_IDEDE|nr:lipid A export permease/ATP-binding protein MsbA [Ideonella dechloratans]KAB0583180.1 lipid A export permease/ATP-binding protein MsbA [Ideonella dechloratans]UFU10693.1 lipid A export permease/ATP-binding protein MsbA [Ideonella dechloratans]
MSDSVQVYRRLLGYTRPYWRTAALALLAMAAAAALEPLVPTLLQHLVDKGLIGKDPQAGWRLPLLLALTFAAKGLVDYVANVASQAVAQHAMSDLRQEVFRHQTGLPLAEHQSRSHGRMLSSILNDIPLLSQALSSAWIIVIRDTLIIIGLTVKLFLLAWHLTLLILLVAPVVAILIRVASRKLRVSNEAMRTLAGQLAGQLEAGLSGVKELKIFGARDYESGRFNQLSEDLRRASMRAVRVQSANVPLVQVLAALAVSGVIFVVMTLSARNLLTPGEFFGFVTAMSLLFEPIRRLTNINGTIQSGLASARGLFDLLDQPLEPEGQGTPLPAATPLQPIVFDHVTFSYPGQERPALQDFCLTLPPGQTVALVGSSGSGKTTVAQLLARFYSPQQGAIHYGPHDIAGLELRSWREQLAWVGQQVVLFDDSVAANMAYGRPDLPREQIVEAARAAHAWEFIERLPQQLDAPCGHNGLNLSGGQRQRIAIARAFLKDAPVLILDEATSALDNESERQVQEALNTLARHRTTLVIAHRLSTIESADWIVAMDQGRVVEQGRHAELLARGGLYARLHQSQAQGGDSQD